MKTVIEKKLANPEFARLYAEEKFVVDVLEAICGWMKEVGMSRADLARRLGTSRANVTKILNGRNVSLRTIASIAHSLKLKPKFTLSRIIEETEGWHCSEVIYLDNWRKTISPEVSFSRELNNDVSNFPSEQRVQA